MNSPGVNTHQNTMGTDISLLADQKAEGVVEQPTVAIKVSTINQRMGSQIRNRPRPEVPRLPLVDSRPNNATRVRDRRNSTLSKLKQEFNIDLTTPRSRSPGRSIRHHSPFCTTHLPNMCHFGQGKKSVQYEMPVTIKNH